MVTLFNRKELCITFSMKDQTRIRECLTQNGVDYHIKTVNRMSPSLFDAGSRTRTTTGSLGQNMDLNYEYIFYVRKIDFDNAKSLINK